MYSILNKVSLQEVLRYNPKSKKTLLEHPVSRYSLLLLKVLLIISYPVYASETSPLRVMVKHYDLEFIVGGCLMALLVGSMAGMLYPMPETSRISDPRLKLLLSALGGLCAFVYTIGLPQSGSGLSSILWVGLVAFISPSTAENITALIVATIRKFFRV
jgi:hypothetical protein